MVDRVEQYLQELKERARARVISSRVSLKKNIGKRTGKKISVGGIAEISGLFRSFDSDSSDTSFIKDKPPLNSTSISTKTNKRLPPPPKYESESAGEENGEVSQPTDSNNKLDSDYGSYSLAVDSSSAKPPDQTLSRTYVDQATQCTTPDGEGQKDLSHREIATQLEQGDESLPDQRAAAEKTSQSDSRHQSNINRTSDSQGIFESVISSRKSAKKSQSRERESRTGSPRKKTVATPSGKPDILKEYKQMISSEKSRSIIHDGTRTGSLTKKTALTPKQSHQKLLRRKLSFKASSQGEGSPKPAIIVSPREVSAIYPFFELDNRSSDGREEVIIDANDLKAQGQEKVGLVFVPTPKVNNPSLLRRRQSSTKRDGKTEKKSSKKSEESETGTIEKSKTESRGRPKSREKSFSDSKNKRDSSSAGHSARRSTGCPRPQSKRSLNLSESRQDASTSAERRPSQRAKKIGKPYSRILVEYSSSSQDDEDYAQRREKKFPGCSPPKAVHNHSRTGCRLSNRERRSHHETLGENDIAVSDDVETPRERPSLNINLTAKDTASIDDRESERKHDSSREKTREQVSEKRNKERVRNSRTSRGSITSDSENEEKRKSSTGKGRKKKPKAQSVKPVNETDNTSTQSDLPYKKRRSNSFRIDEQTFEGDQRDLSNWKTSSRSNPRRLFASSSNDSESDQPTAIEKHKSPNRSKQQSPKKQRKTTQGKKTNKAHDTALDQPEQISNAVLEIDNTAGSAVSLSTSQRKRKLDSDKNSLRKSLPKVGKRKAVQSSPRLQLWLDSGQNKSSFSVQPPVTKQSESSDITKSTVIKRRSRKIIVEDSPARFVAEQPKVEHSPLPTADESEILTSVDPNRVFVRSSNNIGPPASTPRKFQLTHENLLAHDRNESIINAAPPSSPLEDPPYVRAEMIHSKSEDSRDFMSRDSYTLPEPLAKKTRTENKTAPKRDTDERSKSLRKDMKRGAKSKNQLTKNSKDNSEQDEEQRTIVAEHKKADERSKSSRKDMKRGAKSKNQRTKNSKDNSEQDEEQRTIVAEHKKADERSKSSRKDMKRGAKSKNQPTKNSKDNDEQDEEQRTIVASDHERTLVEESPKKKHNKTTSRITKKMGKLQSGPLFLHERDLDIVVPEGTAMGIRRSKRIRTSRPLGYGEKLVFSKADKHGARKLIGFQSSNGLVSFHTEEVQGKVHIEAKLPDVSDKNRNVKKSNKNPRKKARKKKMEDKIEILKGVASKRTEENAGDSGNEQENTAWFDGMDIASTEGHDVDSASGTEENRSVTNKTIQLVNHVTGSFVATDVSSIYVNESGIDGQYVGSIYNRDGVNVTKGISSKVATQGKLSIEPQKEKNERIVHNGDMIFSLLKGTVKVTIGDTGITIKEGGYIIVPCKNPYRIYNLSSKIKAELVYTLVRVP